MNFRHLFRRRRSDRDLTREIAAHLDAERAENLARGLSAEEAERRARIKFGSALTWTQRSTIASSSDSSLRAGRSSRLMVLSPHRGRINNREKFLRSFLLDRSDALTQTGLLMEGPNACRLRPSQYGHAPDEFRQISMRESLHWK